MFDVEGTVQISQISRVEVHIDCVMIVGHDELCLLHVCLEKVRLVAKILFETHYSGDLSRLKIQLKYLVWFCKDYGINLILIRHFEMELHGHLLEQRNVFDDDSLMENK